jgi:WD40 repeat protein
VAVTPDGRRIVTGAVDGSAKVWEAATGKELLPLKGHSNVVWSVAISPDGERILSGSDDNTARVWDTVSGKPRLTLNGHIDGVACAVFSPDGQRIVTGSRDGTVKVWEAASGEELLTLKGHSSGLWSAVFSPNGERIATASEDQTAKVWNVATEGQVAAWQQEEKATAKRLAVSVPDQSTPAEQDRALRAHDPGAIKQWLVLAPIPVESQGGKGGRWSKNRSPRRPPSARELANESRWVKASGFGRRCN